MLKLITLAVVLIVRKSTEEYIYDNILEYTKNLSAVYKDPGHVFGEDLLRTAVFYLDELMELEEALEDKDEENKAVKMLVDLYNKGGPQHIGNVPYGILIDTYGWKSAEIDDMARYMEITSHTWQRLCKVIESFIRDGKLKDHGGQLLVL